MTTRRSLLASRRLFETSRRSFLASAGVAAVATAGCLRSTPADLVGATDLVLTVGVTTSTYDSGLVDELHAAFESAYGVSVRAIPRGTGETIAAGERGDVDVVMAHARSLEDDFVRSGDGINRRAFARSDFLVAGPPADPAAIANVDTAAAAFDRLASADATFVSRGDDSGTHRRERAIWTDADVGPGGDWYLEVGQGMGETLVLASQRGAYLLTVRGTFVAMRDRLDLRPFVEGPIAGGDPALENRYGIIVVNPAVHDGVAYELAMLYVGFLTGATGQRLVAEYAVDGERVFRPDGLAETPDFDQYLPRDGGPANASAVGAPADPGAGAAPAGPGAGGEATDPSAGGEP